MNKIKIQFSHANGFPASAYSYFFDKIKGAEIRFVDKIGHGDYQLDDDLYNLADELIADIESNWNEPVVGIGHSVGGVLTIMAACKRPELFKQVIVFDPVIFSKKRRFVIGLFRFLGLIDYLGPIKRTLKRQRKFANSEVAKTYFESKRLFKKFHPKSLENYIKYGLTPLKNNEVELAFSPSIEADIFRSIISKLPKNIRKLQGVLIYADKSAIFLDSDVCWWKKSLPNFETIEFSGEHLAPLEQPEEFAELINSFLVKHEAS